MRLNRVHLLKVSFVVVGLLSLIVGASAQGIVISPAAPAVSTGGTITITADRPVKFGMFGYGSLGAETATSAVYSAPTSGLYPQHLLNGCMVGPNDSVFNMRIDSLPVDANSASWTPFILSNGAVLGYKWGTNVVNNSTPMAVQQFVSTTQLNGSSFPAPPQTALKRQNGAYTTDGNVDHHVLSLNTQTCQFYEINQQGISFSQCPTCTADSGWTYASTSYALPNSGVGGGSADPSGLPLAALTLHVSEIRAGHISHALRFTACAACVSAGVRWPATSSAGTQSGAPPVGTRFRLKSSFSTAGFTSAAQRILVALQQYGMILAGPGPDGEITVSTDVTEDAGTVQALQSLAGGVLNYSNFDVVDESKYMLSTTSSAVNPLNGFSYPVSFAMLTVTDAANSKNVVSVPIALQPVMAGIAEPTITVQAGMPAFQIPNWVTGSTNQAINWTISPAGAGTISAGGVYTPPASVNTPLGVGLSLISAVNTIPFATAGVSVTVIPAGAIRIDSGSAVSTIDDRGLTWMRDIGFETGNSTIVNDVSPQNAWSNAYNHTVWQTYQYTAGNDIVYKFRVPNGAYAVQLMFGVGDCAGSFSGLTPGNAGLLWGPLNLQAQANVFESNWDFGVPIGDQCQTPESSSTVAQVIDNTLSVAIRATGGEGQHTAPLINGITITPVGSSALTDPAFNQSTVAGTTPTFNIQEFDANCGQIGYNCRAAFQNAFGMFADTGGGTLNLPAGTFLVDFPDLAQNVASAPWFTAGSLVAVPPNTSIVGHLAPNGTPDTIIQWQSTSAPIFTFAKASNSSMQNLHISFIGTTSTLSPYGDIVLLKALGYNTTYPHLNEMSGGSYEMFTFAMVFDSDNTTFNNLIFDSATLDNNHLSGTAVNIKGKGVIVNGGGGLTTLANGNTINNVQIYDFLSGFTVAGQNNFKITNITADWRGSGLVPAGPGHLLYTTSTNQADPSGNVLSVLQSTNVTIQNITEGPDTFNNANSGGTLAIKCINGGLVDTITSQHPVGLIQTLYEDQNITFSNMNWRSNYDLCANYPANCSGPVIYSTMTSPQFFTLQNLTFSNVNLTSTITPISVLLMGDGLVVNGMNIQTPPTFLPNQVAKTAILGVKATTKATVSNFTYTPLITSYNPYGNYNNVMMSWHPSSNVTGQVTIRWPSAIPVPTGVPIVSSGYQDANSNNSVNTNIVLY